MTMRFGPAAMRLGALAARGLGWRPDEFWRATPAELAMACADPAAAHAGPLPLTRAELARLMEQNDDG